MTGPNPVGLLDIHAQREREKERHRQRDLVINNKIGNLKTRNKNNLFAFESRHSTIYKRPFFFIVNKFDTLDFALQILS